MPDIRPETSADAAAIETVILEAYHAGVAPAVLRHRGTEVGIEHSSTTCQEIPDEETFREVLSDMLVSETLPGEPYEPAMSLVAEVDGAVVGHVQLGYGLLDSSRGGQRALMVVTTIAVLPDHRGREVGRALKHAAVDTAQDEGAALVIAVGAPGFFRRCCFVSGQLAGTIAPNGIPLEAMSVHRTGWWHDDYVGKPATHPLFEVLAAL